MFDRTGKIGAFGKFIIVIVCFVILGLLFWVGYKIIAENGIYFGASQTKQLIKEQGDKIRNLTDANGQLQETVDQKTRDEKGLSLGWLLGICAGIALIALIVLMLANPRGKRLTCEECHKYCCTLLVKYYDLHFFKDRPGSPNVWKRVTWYTGDVVEGDDGNWIICEYAKDFPAGDGAAVSAECFTFSVKSNEHLYRTNMHPGLTAIDVAELHKIKLQRSMKPTDLAKILEDTSYRARIARDQEILENGGPR